MIADRWNHIEPVLDTILEAEPNEWLIRAKNICGEDEKLLKDVVSLLKRMPDVRNFLETNPASSLMNLRFDDELTAGFDDLPQIQKIGRYRLIKKIAYGGMGSIFLAERDDGAYQQKVALKLLHASLDSKKMRSRFKTERQILASFNHPNIIRLLDGGVVSSKDDLLNNRPYLVMEYLEGEPINSYCRRKNLNLRERLHLFMKVAEAVNHAHQNLIIHCDVKPSNILITGDGQIKLLDFGIARLLDEHSANMEDLKQPGEQPATLTHQRWLTPEYAAPEQLKSERLTTAVDIYQMGILLYELLTGNRPFKNSENNLFQLEQAILHKDPEKPSTTGVEDKTRRELRGDLDTIVLKALRKEPEERYHSVSGFIEDIRRYLTGQPVFARRGNTVYRVRKFISRYQWETITTIFVFLVISALVVTYTLRLAVERDHAELAALQAQLEAETTEQVTEFLLGLFEAAGPDEALGVEITAQQILERGIERAEELSEQPELQARMFHVMGRVYRQLGDYEKARPLLERTLSIRESLYDANQEEVAFSMNALATLYQNQGDYAAAEPLFREALSIRRQLYGEDHEKTATSLNNLGLLLVLKGNYDKAEPYYLESLSIVRNLPDAGLRQIATKINNLAALYYVKGDPENAEPYYREALELYKQEYGEEHRQIAMVMDNLGKVLIMLEQYEEAEILIQQSLSMFEKILGENHPDVAITLSGLASLSIQMDHIENAERYYQRALEINRNHFGDKHHYLAGDLIGLGNVYLIKNDAVAAYPFMVKALEIYENTLSEGDWRIGNAKGWVGQALADLEKYEEAEPYILNSYSMIKNQLSLKSRYTRAALRRLAAFYESWNKPDQAKHYYTLLAEDDEVD